MKILAIDPGKTTGFYIANRAQGIDMDSGAGQAPQEDIWRLLDGLKPEVVVIEKFSFRGGHTKIDYSPAEVIGVVREWCRQKDVDLHFQTPSQAKHYWGDERLKERNLYNVGMPHANDAVRHFLYFTEFGGGKNA